MKLTSMLAVIMVICLGLGIQTSTAQGPDLGALNIAAIKSIQINADESGYYSEVMVLLENSGDKALKLKNVNFDVRFKEKDKIIPFGTAPLKEIIIPSSIKESSSKGKVDAILRVKIGPKDDKTVGLLIQLFNIIGNPSNSLVMILEGTGEVGTKIEKGWIYHTGMKAELEFVPTIQREILFK